MAERRSGGGGLSGSGLRDLLSSGIAGLESVPAVRAEPPRPSAPTGRAPRAPEAAPRAVPLATMPPIDHFVYRGPSALAAARQLAAHMAQAAHPPDPTALDELHDLLRLAGEG